MLFEWGWSIEPTPHPQCAEFRARPYEAIDARFREYFDKQPKALIRLGEVRWGGVRRDGIPPLKNPKMIAAAADAGWLGREDIVSGVATTATCAPTPSASWPGTRWSRTASPGAR